jgi:hypothetical protein
MAIAAISPRQDYAVVRAAGGEVLLTDLRRNRSTVIETAVASPDRIALSPTGSSAALYHAETATLQIVTGLPGAQAAKPAFRIPALASALADLAVSDDGAVILAVTGEGALLALGPDSPLPVAVPGSISQVVFRAGTHEALAADSNNNQVWLVALDPAPRYRLLAGALEGVSAPAAVAFSDDGSRAYIAVRAGVLAVDVQSGGVTRVPCQCAPTGLRRIGGDSMFLLTESPGKPLFLLDGRQSLMWLIPPFAPRQEEQQ